MKFFLMFFLSFFVMAPSFATDFAKAIDDQITVIQNISFKTASEMTAGSCVRRYQSLLSDRRFNILIGFGYSDSAPADIVFDWFMVNGFIRALTAPCQNGVSACGFLRSKTDTDLFVKTVQDLQGNPVRVEVMVLRGSLSGSHAQNTSAANLLRQNIVCKNVTDKFFSEMMKGPEIVYYSGHSRNGGGPDFCPPKVLGNGHVDYDWYERMHPGMTRLLDALARSTKDTQVLAMHSCSSISHFYQKVRAIKPKMAFLGSTNPLGMLPDFQNQFGGLDSFLSYRCEKGLRSSMNQGVGIDVLNLFTK